MFLQVLSRCQALSYILYIDHLIYHSQQPYKAGATIIPHFIGMGAERLLNNLAPVTEPIRGRANKVVHL